MSISLARLVPLVAMVVSVPAQAAVSSEALAEHTRLAEEMRRLASRNAWRGVEAKYKEMLVLEKKKGVQLTYDDHLFGAQAARDSGRITDVYARLERARQIEATSEVTDWMADIDANYGSVKLVKDDRWVGTPQLVTKELPFAPDQRAAIGTATGIVSSTGGYTGRLPFGDYSYGGQDFSLVKGGGVAEVTLAPVAVARRQHDKDAKRRDGFRVDVGPLYTAVGESGAPGVHPQAYSGMGVRAGLGWEIELSHNLGMLAQAGYHGMLSGGAGSLGTADSGELDLSTNPQVESFPSSLNLFYLWGGVSYWLGDLAIMAGPSWAGGSARSTGLVANCSDPSAPGCDTVDPSVSDSVREVSPINGGFVKTGGGTLGIFYGFTDVPGMHKARLGVSVYGGAQSDLATLYPWGQLAITIAPGI